MASASSSARWVGRWSSRNRLGQRAESAVGHVVAQEPAGERRGVDDGRADRRPAVALERGPQEREVEADVVGDEDAVADEVDERAEHGTDARGRRHQGIGEPGEHGDPRRDRATGVDERVERRQALAAADLDDADLGDHVVVPVAAGGLEVEHAERGFGERVRRDRRSCAVPTSRRPPSAAMEARTYVRVKNNRSEHGADPERYDHWPWTAAAEGTGVGDTVCRAGRARAPSSPQSALEFAVAMAQEGQKLSPPLKYPAALKTYFKMSPSARNGARPVRRILEGDDTFRTRLADGRGARARRSDRVPVAPASRGLGGARSPVCSPTPPTRRPVPTPRLRCTVRPAEREAAEQLAARSRAETRRLQQRVS